MYIFILDLDGTIVGDVKYQVTKFSLQNSLKNHGHKPKHRAPPASFHPDMKLLRPGFGSWVKAIKAAYPDSHFFIYTASEKMWAQVEVPWIEKSIGVKFDRPIFCRDDCVADYYTYKKSINKLLPRIWKSVGKKLSAQEREVVVRERLMIVDNTAVYVDHADRMLLCPDYNYAVFEDILEGIPKSFHGTNAVLSLMNQGLVCPSNGAPSSDPVKAMAQKYGWLAKRCHSIVNNNALYVHDQFWRILRKLMTGHNIATFSPSTIKELQERCWEATHKIKKIKSGTS